MTFLSDDTCDTSRGIPPFILLYAYRSYFVGLALETSLVSWLIATDLRQQPWVQVDETP